MSTRCEGSYGDREDCRVRVWWLDKDQNYVNTFYNNKLLLQARGGAGHTRGKDDFKRNIIFSDSIIVKQRQVFSEMWTGSATSGSFCTAVKKSALSTGGANNGDIDQHPESHFYYLSPIPVDSSNTAKSNLWISDATFADNSINIANIYLSIGNHCSYNKSHVTSTATIHSMGKAINSSTSSGSNSRDFDNIGSAYAVLCKFYDHRSQFIVNSKSIQIVPGMLVRCPVPSILRVSNKNKIQLKIQLTRKVLNKMISSFDHTKDAITGYFSGLGRGGDNEIIISRIFPICPPVRKIAKLSHNLRNHENEAKKIAEKNFIIDKMLLDNYVHNISVCSSITNEGSSPLHIVEFVEYYRLLGVAHFFLYDTRDQIGTYRGASGSVDDDNGKEGDRYRYYNDGLEDIMQEYQSLGILTLVKWSNRNCYGTGGEFNERSGDTCKMSNSKANDLLTTAQASCYLRFKSTSNWILSLKTINEFLLLYKYNRFSKSSSNYLMNFIANYENTNSKIIAFEFRKKTAVYCPDGKNNGQLPVNILSSMRGSGNDSKIIKRDNTDEETFLKPYRFGVYNAYISGGDRSNERLLVKTDLVSSIINEEIVVSSATKDNSLVINLVSDLKKGGVHIIDSNSKTTKALLSNIHNSSSAEYTVRNRPSEKFFQDGTYSNINSKEITFKNVIDGNKNSENNLQIAEVNFYYGAVFSYFEMFGSSKSNEGSTSYCTLSRDVNRIARNEVLAQGTSKNNLSQRVNERICKSSEYIKDLSYLFDSNSTFEDSMYLGLVTRMTAVVEGSIPD